MAKNTMDFIFTSVVDANDFYEGDKVGVKDGTIYSEKEDNFGRKYWMKLETLGNKTNAGAVVIELAKAISQPRKKK